MAENETTQEEHTTEDGGSGARTAVKAAAAAAATGAAAMAVKKALSGSNGHSKNGEGTSGEGSTRSQGSSSLFTSIASGGWEAARDALLPLAEDAAGAAGSYVAKNGPEIVRDKIVPKFITSFNEARKED